MLVIPKYQTLVKWANFNLTSLKWALWEFQPIFQPFYKSAQRPQSQKQFWETLLINGEKGKKKKPITEIFVTHTWVKLSLARLEWSLAPLGCNYLCTYLVTWCIKNHITVFVQLCFSSKVRLWVTSVLRQSNGLNFLYWV